MATKKSTWEDDLKAFLKKQEAMPWNWMFSNPPSPVVTAALREMLRAKEEMMKKNAKWKAEDLSVNPKLQEEMRRSVQEEASKMAGTAKTAYIGKDGHWHTMIDGKEVPAKPSLQERVDELKRQINTMSYEYSHKAVELIKASGCIELIHDEEMLVWQASDRFEQDIEAAIDKAGTRVAITSLTGLVHNLATDIHNKEAVNKALDKASKRVKKERSKRNVK